MLQFSIVHPSNIVPPFRIAPFRDIIKITFYPERPGQTPAAVMTGWMWLMITGVTKLNWRPHKGTIMTDLGVPHLQT